MTIRFAAIGINHSHIDGQVNCLLKEGAEFVSFYAPEDDLAVPFGQKFSQAKRVSDPKAILEDQSIQMVLTSAILNERADISIAAMQHGKDVMSDKPGMTSHAQLEAIRRVQKETGRIYSVCYSEHFETRSTVKAGELVQAGAIGEVIHTVGLGPHAIRNNQRPDWFYDRKRYGGILCDIGSHQIEQFLYYADCADATVVHSKVGNFNNPDHPELEDFGDATLIGDNGATNYFRVDWFTPSGLSTWGDGRLQIIGTDGYIELRKYLDVARSPIGDHLYLVNGDGEQHMQLNGKVGFPFFGQFILDCIHRTENAMTQQHAFLAAKLCLDAQEQAQRIQVQRP